MKNNYTRYQSKAEDAPIGTFVVQTSGNANLIGDPLLISDFNTHSYQVIPTSGVHNGSFEIHCSNDGVNWTSNYSKSFTNTADSVTLYSEKWLYKYSRVVVTGNASGFYLINEIHGRF